MVSWISSYAAGLASPDTLLAGGDMSAAALLSGTTAAAAAAAAATEVVFSPTTNADLLLFPAMNDDHYGEQTASLQENGFLFFEGECNAEVAAPVADNAYSNATSGGEACTSREDGIFVAHDDKESKKLKTMKGVDDAGPGGGKGNDGNSDDNNNGSVDDTVENVLVDELLNVPSSVELSTHTVVSDAIDYAKQKKTTNPRTGDLPSTRSSPLLDETKGKATTEMAMELKSAATSVIEAGAHGNGGQMFLKSLNTMEDHNGKDIDAADRSSQLFGVSNAEQMSKRMSRVAIDADGGTIFKESECNSSMMPIKEQEEKGVQESLAYAATHTSSELVTDRKGPEAAAQHMPTMAPVSTNVHYEDDKWEGTAGDPHTGVSTGLLGKRGNERLESSDGGEVSNDLSISFLGPMGAVDESGTAKPDNDNTDVEAEEEGQGREVLAVERQQILDEETVRAVEQKKQNIDAVVVLGSVGTGRAAGASRKLTYTLRIRSHSHAAAVINNGVSFVSSLPGTMVVAKVLNDKSSKEVDYDPNAPATLVTGKRRSHREAFRWKINFENTFGGNRLSVGDVQHVSESPGTLTTSAIMEENAKEMVGRSIGGVETTMMATDSLGVFLLDSHSLLQTEQVDQGTPSGETLAEESAAVALELQAVTLVLAFAPAEIDILAFVCDTVQDVTVSNFLPISLSEVTINAAVDVLTSNILGGLIYEVAHEDGGGGETTDNESGKGDSVELCSRHPGNKSTANFALPGKKDGGNGADPDESSLRDICAPAAVESKLTFSFSLKPHVPGTIGEPATTNHYSVDSDFAASLSSKTSLGSASLAMFRLRHSSFRSSATLVVESVTLRVCTETASVLVPECEHVENILSGENGGGGSGGGKGCPSVLDHHHHQQSPMSPSPLDSALLQVRPDEDSFASDSSSNGDLYDFGLLPLWMRAGNAEVTGGSLGLETEAVLLPGGLPMLPGVATYEQNRPDDVLLLRPLVDPSLLNDKQRQQEQEQRDVPASICVALCLSDVSGRSRVRGENFSLDCDWNGFMSRVALTLGLRGRASIGRVVRGAGSASEEELDLHGAVRWKSNEQHCDIDSDSSGMRVLWTAGSSCMGRGASPKEIGVLAPARALRTASIPGRSMITAAAGEGAVDVKGISASAALAGKRELAVIPVIIPDWVGHAEAYSALFCAQPSLSRNSALVALPPAPGSRGGLGRRGPAMSFTGVVGSGAGFDDIELKDTEAAVSVTEVARNALVAMADEGEDEEAATRTDMMLDLFVALACSQGAEALVKHAALGEMTVKGITKPMSKRGEAGAEAGKHNNNNNNHHHQEGNEEDARMEEALLKETMTIHDHAIFDAIAETVAVDAATAAVERQVGRGRLGLLAEHATSAPASRQGSSPSFASSDHSVMDVVAAVTAVGETSVTDGKISRDKIALDRGGRMDAVLSMAALHGSSAALVAEKPATAARRINIAIREVVRQHEHLDCSVRVAANAPSLRSSISSDSSYGSRALGIATAGALPQPQGVKQKRAGARAFLAGAVPIPAVAADPREFGISPLSSSSSHNVAASFCSSTLPSSFGGEGRFELYGKRALAVRQWLQQEKEKGRVMNELADALWGGLLADAARDIGRINDRCEGLSTLTRHFP